MDWVQKNPHAPPGDITYCFVLFILAAKRYKYRTRDEGMFRQYEEIYDRYIDQAE
jgi:hypothetical protein